VPRRVSQANDITDMLRVLEPLIKKEYEYMMSHGLRRTWHTVLPMLIARYTSGFNEFFEKMVEVYSYIGAGSRRTALSRSIRQVAAMFREGAPCTCGYRVTVPARPGITVLSARADTVPAMLCPFSLATYIALCDSRKTLYLLEGGADLDKDVKVFDVGPVKLAVSDKPLDLPELLPLPVHPATRRHLSRGWTPLDRVL